MHEQLAECLRHLPPRMSHVVRPWAERIPAAPALMEGDRVVSYGELAGTIAAVGAWLKHHGLRPGDRAMIVGENSIALAVLVLAIGEIDAWPLVTNARISAREIDVIRDHSGARFLLYTTGVSADAARHAERDGARIETVPGIGAVAVGTVNDKALPEPVSLDGSSVSPQELFAFAAERLAPYKRPAQIVVEQAPPATTAGKILKHQLAQEAANHGT